MRRWLIAVAALVVVAGGIAWLQIPKSVIVDAATARSARPTISSTSSERRPMTLRGNSYIFAQNARFSRGERGAQGDLLPDDADRPADRDGVAGDAGSRDGGVAPRRREQAREHRDGGGLAGAVGAEQSEDLALGHAEGDAGDGDLPVVGLAETGDLDAHAYRPRSGRPACSHAHSQNEAMSAAA